jgi:2-haloacid dehalogenase/putative hydrolase of the HAD superfamily
LIEELYRRGVPQFGLSNMSLEVWDDVRAMSPCFDRLSDVVLSAAEGCIKPERRIYEISVERSGLAPHQLIFVDDNLANIEAARALGFAVHHFTDPAALRPALHAHGLL